MLAVYQRGHDQISRTPYISRHSTISLHAERSLGAKRIVNSQRQEARNSVPGDFHREIWKETEGAGLCDGGDGELQFPMVISDL